jgi:hypothetical protein
LVSILATVRLGELTTPKLGELSSQQPLVRIILYSLLRRVLQ